MRTGACRQRVRFSGDWQTGNLGKLSLLLRHPRRAIQQDCFLSDMKKRVADDSHESDACFRINDILVTLFNCIREAPFKIRISLN